MPSESNVSNADRDRRALDAIATLLGTSPEWSPAADFLEEIANLVGRTERPHPGDAADTYRRDFFLATGRNVQEAYAHDPDDGDTIGAV